MKIVDGVLMQLSRSTPGTHLYKELDDQERPVENMRDAKIGQQYIRKNCFQNPNSPPNRIRITVEEA